VNLGLRVLGRRRDGYHCIESLFVPLDLADQILLSLVPGGEGCLQVELEGECEGVPQDASNLAARAAGAFLEATGLRYGVRLRLSKRIPAGAGLGGGSSDAGSILRALAGRFPGALAGRELERLALSLGADVPFFLDPRPARVRGIGERIEAVGALPALALLLATPAPGLATQEVYRAYDAGSSALTPEGGALTMPLPSTLRGGDGRLRIDALRHLLVNDLEPAARALRPAIGRVLRRIEASGALAAGMSGSGPTVFGVFESLVAARHARATTAWDAAVQVRVARTTGAA
jgi:4-diphosphocytidyl-2-C-methyl-D-erythritol kinase